MGIIRAVIAVAKWPQLQCCRSRVLERNPGIHLRLMNAGDMISFKRSQSEIG